MVADSTKLISLHGDGLIRFGKLFLGFNRVVHDYKGMPYLGRGGSGLCGVCIRFYPGLPDVDHREK